MNVWWRIACAAAATPLLALCLHTLSIAPASAEESWRITGLKPEARIHLRERAHRRSKIVAYIPGDARGLSRGACSNGWCEVEYNGREGWVFARYLAPDPQARNRPALAASEETPLPLARKGTLQLAKGAGSPISVYAFPNDKLPVAGRLPPETATVEGLGSCIRDMCYIRAGDLVGWLKAEAMQSEEAAEAEAEETEEKEAIAALAQNPSAEESEALNKTVPTASQAPLAAATVLRGLGDIDTKSYALAGLAGQNSLAIREQPDGTSRILAWIPHTAKDVEGLRKCVEKWCLVRHGDVSGWVARRHLADPSVESSQIFQVKGVEIWGNLDVLDYPNPNANVVGRIPSYATGIVPIGGCDDDWCHVRYLGIAGWVNGGHLQPQAR